MSADMSGINELSVPMSEESTINKPEQLTLISEDDRLSTAEKALQAGLVPVTAYVEKQTHDTRKSGPAAWKRAQRARAKQEGLCTLTIERVPEALKRDVMAAARTIINESESTAPSQTEIPAPLLIEPQPSISHSSSTRSKAIIAFGASAGFLAGFALGVFV